MGLHIRKFLNRWKDTEKRLLVLEENIRNNNELIYRFDTKVFSLKKELSDNIERLKSDYVKDLNNSQNKYQAKLNSEINKLKEKNINSNIQKYTNKESNEQIPIIDESEDCYYEIDYFDFEDYFRGSREHIKNVQECYLKYFKDKNKVIDLGCGRGEFLELLKENDISAVGVDCYDTFVEYCKLQKLNVVKEDALKFLENLDYADGIFAGQLVEHLSINQIIKLCDLSYNKLTEGSYLVIETPNPMSLAIYTHAFYIDPSHVKPVHPLMMKYLLQKSGFKDVEIIFTENSKIDVRIPKIESKNIKNIDEFNKSMKIVEDTLFGSQDYVIVAKK